MAQLEVFPLRGTTEKKFYEKKYKKTVRMVAEGILQLQTFSYCEKIARET